MLAVFDSVAAYLSTRHHVAPPALFSRVGVFILPFVVLGPVLALGFVFLRVPGWPGLLVGLPGLGFEFRR